MPRYQTLNETFSCAIVPMCHMFQLKYRISWCNIVCITIYCRIDILSHPYSQTLLSADGASEVCFVLTDVLFVDLQDKSRWLIRHYQYNCLQLPVRFSKSSHVWLILWTHFLLCSTYSSNRSSVSIFLCSHTAHAWHYCLQNVVIHQCRGSHRYHYSYCYRYNFLCGRP